MIRWVKFRAIVHATESVDKVRRALATVCGEAAGVKPSFSKGTYGNPIIILEATLDRKKEIDAFIKRLISSGCVRRERVEDDVPDYFQSENCTDDFIPEWGRARAVGFLSGEDIYRRLDDDCVLHFRFDKQRAYHGELVPVSHADVISVSAKVIVYPSRKDAAAGAFSEYISGLMY